ncbi:hypothetical protein [Paraburkholderia fungorum]|uniref:hypothetical protein n=1 Tax=Paraburkholderia fungorum TaxID=134537 RepID=UPI00402B5B8A
MSTPVQVGRALPGLLAFQQLGLAGVLHPASSPVSCLRLLADGSDGGEHRGVRVLNLTILPASSGSTAKPSAPLSTTP